MIILISRNNQWLKLWMPMVMDLTGSVRNPITRPIIKDPNSTRWFLYKYVIAWIATRPFSILSLSEELWFSPETSIPCWNARKFFPFVGGAWKSFLSPRSSQVISFWFRVFFFFEFGTMLLRKNAILNRIAKLLRIFLFESWKRSEKKILCSWNWNSTELLFFFRCHGFVKAKNSKEWIVRGRDPSIFRFPLFLFVNIENFR